MYTCHEKGKLYVHISQENDMYICHEHEVCKT